MESHARRPHDRPRLDRRRRSPSRTRSRCRRVRGSGRTSPDRGMGEPPVHPRRQPVDRPTRVSPRPSRSASAGSMPRSTSRSRSRVSRPSVTPSSTRATRPRSWPAWAAAASPPTSCAGRSARPRATSSCGSSTRPTPPTSDEVLDDLDPLRTLVIIASKSGTTTEPNAFLAYAWARAEAALDGGPPPSLRASRAPTSPSITDPGKSDAIKNSNDFREIFLNPPDIGGRYSALTYVGLVPASLIGVDLDPLLAAGAVMLGACHEPDPALNPGLSLGHRHRDAGQGRPRQADVPDRRRDRGLRGVG